MVAGNIGREAFVKYYLQFYKDQEGRMESEDAERRRLDAQGRLDEEQRRQDEQQQQARLASQAAERKAKAAKKKKEKEEAEAERLRLEATAASPQVSPRSTQQVVEGERGALPCAL